MWTQDDNWLVWNDGFITYNIVMGTLMLTVLTLMSIFYYFRLYQQSGKKWCERIRSSPSDRLSQGGQMLSVSTEPMSLSR